MIILNFQCQAELFHLFIVAGTNFSSLPFIDILQMGMV